MKYRFFIPVAISLCVATLAVYRWQGQRVRRRHYIEHETDLALSIVMAELGEQIEERILTLENFTESISHVENIDYEYWKLEAIQLIEDFGGYQTIALLNNTYTVEWIVPSFENDAGRNLNYVALLENHPFLDSEDRESITITLAKNEFYFNAGGLASLVPIYAEEKIRGYVLGTIGLNELLTDISGVTFQSLSEHFSIQIGHSGINIYGHEGSLESNYWVKEGELELQGTQWQVRVSPRKSYFVVHDVHHPEYMLVLEILFGVILGVVFHLYLYAKQLNQHLESKVQDRTASLNKSLDFEAALKSITNRVRETLKEEEILCCILQELAPILQNHNSNISLFHEDSHRIRLAYQYPERSIPLEGLQRPDILHGSLNPNTLNFRESFQICLLPAPENSQQETVLVQPILGNGGGVQGDIWLFRSSDRPFDDSEIRLVEQVAVQCAIAIRQANLYQSVQEKVVWLQHLNNLKDEFISTVSHELRTPLASIKLALSLIPTTSSESKKKQYFEVAANQCEREILLVNELLDLQKLESEKEYIQTESVDVDKLLHQIAETAEMTAHQNEQHFFLDLPASLGWVHTNVQYLSRILGELLSNASKYTPSGGKIELRVRRDEAGLEFAVVNTSEIPSECLPYLFEKFYRIPGMDFQNNGGTGLGLSLIRGMVDRLRGKISVVSYNGATTFYVFLPQLITHSSIVSTKRFAKAVEERV